MCLLTPAAGYPGRLAQNSAPLLPDRVESARLRLALVGAPDVPRDGGEPSPSHYRLLADLPARLEAALPGHLLDVLSEYLVASLGITEVRLYLVDYGLRVLTPLPGPKAGP